jgi:hypothetical protein
MQESALIAAFATALPSELAEDLVHDFLNIRRDVATGTLGRAAPGKLVETVVQSLQALENAGAYDKQPNVDAYLRGLESRQSSLPDGLRVCAARVGRAMYSLRSKRNIVHKSEVDPSSYDLRFLYSGAQWILTELLALAQGISGDQAARFVLEVQLPVGELVEVLGDRRIVHGSLTAQDELLVVLMSFYPDVVTVKQVCDSMDRCASSTVRNALSALWKAKHVHKPKTGQVVLTQRGLREAIRTAQANLLP